MTVLRPAVLLAAVALAGYAATLVADDPTWPVMVLWFLAAVALHDAVLVPLYSGADRLLVALAAGPGTGVPLVNHVRAPVLASGLTLLVYLPGIIRQGEAAVVGATGLDQSPFLGRWLLLVAAFFGLSTLVYVGRAVRRRPRVSGEGVEAGARRPERPRMRSARS